MLGFVVERIRGVAPVEATARTIFRRRRAANDLADLANATWQAEPRNLVRRSDYIGGWALDHEYDESSVVDREIYDPPVLAQNADPSGPPMHLHSDWFPDPQTRRHVEEMKRTVI